MSERILHEPPVTRARSYSLAKRIQQEYHEALLACGLGSSTHVYELGPDSFSPYRNAEARDKLLRILSFYEGLEDVFEQFVFLRDYLEMGSHYPYWFYEYGDSKCWNKTFERISEKWREKQR